MRLVHSVAMLAIATGVVGTTSAVNAASPPDNTQIAQAKGTTAKGGVINKGADIKPGSTPRSIQQQIQSENQKLKSGAPK